MKIPEIWSDTVDNNTYAVSVVRAGDSTGILEVRRVADNVILLNEQVALMYGAMFGPDVSDVAAWKARALEVIDEDEEA